MYMYIFMSCMYYKRMVKESGTRSSMIFHVEIPDSEPILQLWSKTHCGEFWVKLWQKAPYFKASLNINGGANCIALSFKFSPIF